MANSNKYYIKALNCYENGYIEKALEYCEVSISLDLKNKAALNLKGILYYLKGELNNAEATWKLNSQMNNDSVAKKYLENVKSDEEKQVKFVQAVKLVNEVKINEAIELLEQCEQSDFNLINVKNYLCLCYMKQCKYDKVKEKLQKVFEIDKKNEIALNIKKQLMEYDIIKNKVNLKPFLIIGVIILIIIVAAVSKNYIFKIVKGADKSNKNIVLNKSQINQNKKEKQIEKTKQPENLQQHVAVVQFPSADFQNSINSKNFDSLYNYVVEWNSKQLEINDKKLLAEGQKLLADEGTMYFYKKGIEFLQNKDYANAQGQLNKAYSNGSNSYLYQHIIYFLATSYNNSKDFENAIKYYEIYDKNYSSGSYEEMVLYNLALIYKDTDMAKAKQYSDKLTKNYANSIYNNSNIKAILNN